MVQDGALWAPLLEKWRQKGETAFVAWELLHGGIGGNQQVLSASALVIRSIRMGAVFWQ